MDFFRAIPKKRKVRIRGKNGVIFYNPPKYRRWLFGFGNGVFLVGLIFLLYIYWPLTVAMIKYYILPNNTVYVSSGNIISNTQPVIIEKAAEKDIFEIQIPRILATAEIMPNVSAFDSSKYLKALENQKVAQAEGSANPGDGNGKSIFIFAHSTQQGLVATRNNAVFYLLGEMEEGDPIYVSLKGKVYTYQVYQQKVVNASEIKYLGYKEDDKEVLILQTCWPIGTDWKRLLVFAKRI